MHFPYKKALEPQILFSKDYHPDYYLEKLSYIIRFHVFKFDIFKCYEHTNVFATMLKAYFVGIWLLFKKKILSIFHKNSELLAEIIEECWPEIYYIKALD